MHTRPVRLSSQTVTGDSLFQPRRLWNRQGDGPRSRHGFFYARAEVKRERWRREQLIPEHFLRSLMSFLTPEEEV